MFTKEDYREYVRLIGEKEDSMRFFISEIISMVEDERLLRVLNHVKKDEIQHYKLAKALFGYFMKGEKEGRLYKRTLIVVKTRIKDLENGIEVEGKCINISLTGICIEVNQELNARNKLELWIDFHDRPEPLHTFGTLVWIKKIGDVYIGGIEFQYFLSNFYPSFI